MGHFSTCAAVAAVAAGLFACSRGAGETDGGALDARADGGGDSDTGADGDVSDGGDGSVEADTDDSPSPREPTILPVGPEAVFRIGEPGGVDMLATAVVEAGGGLLVVWDRFDAEATRSGLWRSESTDGRAWSAPREVMAGGPAFRAGPSLVRLGDGLWLYHVEADDLYGPAELGRSRLDRGDLGPPESIPPIAGVDWLLSWPRFVALADGGLAVAFRDGRSAPRFGVSADGVSFDPPREVSATGAAMAAVGQAPAGWLAFAYQTGTAGMTAWVHTSPDGLAWSEPLRVTEGSPNVHDTCVVPRLDSDVDLYYIWPCSARGFCLHRRALDGEGRLGPEQRVTEPEVGETSKPSALRLPDGRLLLLWAEITRRGADGAPTEQILGGTLLDGDAPAPD